MIPPPDGLPVPRPEPERLARLEQQLAAGYIGPAEFAEAAAVECALLGPEELAGFCDRAPAGLLAAVRDHVSRVLAASDGFPSLPRGDLCAVLTVGVKRAPLVATANTR